jgi:hypothetical protein
MILAADAALYRAKENGRNCMMATEIEPAGSSGPLPEGARENLLNFDDAFSTELRQSVAPLLRTCSSVAGRRC